MNIFQEIVISLSFTSRGNACFCNCRLRLLPHAPKKTAMQSSRDASDKSCHMSTLVPPRCAKACSKNAGCDATASWREEISRIKPHLAFAGLDLPG